MKELKPQRFEEDCGSVFETSRNQFLHDGDFGEDLQKYITFRS